MRQEQRPSRSGSVVVGRGSWPDAVAYREAIQNPEAVLSDSGLSGASVATDRLGLPIAYTGRFAVVFRLRDRHGVDWAVRCFTQASDQAARAENYAAIDRHLSTLERETADAFVPFRYVARGIRIGTRWFPILVMRWAEGRTLGRWVEDNVADPVALRRVADALDRLLSRLETAGIAHGDWQHDNILVGENGDLTLVDYDGLFVPALAGRPGGEVGHPNYQHPARHSAHFGVGLDRFPCLAITTALRALAREPALWSQFSDGESILFRQSDFARPTLSPLLATLRAVAESDARLRADLDRLEIACASGPSGILLGEALPPLPEIASQADAIVDAARWWLDIDAEAPRPLTVDPERSDDRFDFARRSESVARTGGANCVRWTRFAIGFVLLATVAATFEVGGAAMLVLIYSWIIPLIGYENWPARRLEVEIRECVAIEDAALHELRERLRTARNELRARADGPKSTTSDLIRVKLAAIDIGRAAQLGGIGPSLVLRLRRAGVNTAADLISRTAVDGVPPTLFHVLKDWQHGLAMTAADDLRKQSAADPAAFKSRDALEREVVQLEREVDERTARLADLDSLHRRLPPSHFGAFAARLLFLGKPKP